MLPLDRQIPIGRLSGHVDVLLTHPFICFCLAAAALNAVFAKLGKKAGTSWNISGDPCTGTATDGTNIDGNAVVNPGITCGLCTAGSTSVCRIVKL